jgi:hypothetical protein
MPISHHDCIEFLQGGERRGGKISVGRDRDGVVHALQGPPREDCQGVVVADDRRGSQPIAAQALATERKLGGESLLSSSQPPRTGSPIAHPESISRSGVQTVLAHGDATEDGEPLVRVMGRPTSPRAAATLGTYRSSGCTLSRRATSRSSADTWSFRRSPRLFLSGAR